MHYEARDGSAQQVRTRIVVGADGARSAVARQTVPGAEAIPCVFAYHEIVRSPPTGMHDFDGSRCDVYYQGRLSPDFYGWVFPHGATASVGIGSARKGFRLREAEPRCASPRASTRSKPCDARAHRSRFGRCGLGQWPRCGVAGAAGVVAPASGEGMYYAMEGGRIAAVAAAESAPAAGAALGPLASASVGTWSCVLDLGMMPWFWYSSDKRRRCSSASARIPT